MNNKRNYKKGNRIEIIKTLYATTCLPYRSLRLYGGQVKLTQRLVKKMEQEGLLAIKWTPNGKIVILNDWERTSKEYIKYLPASYIEWYGKSNREMYKSLSDKSRLERLLKNAEVSLLMHLGGIGSYPDEKECLPAPATMLGKETVQYFGSKEIKTCGSYHANIENHPDGSKKVVGSRISGVMVSPGGIYAVYNITNHLIEWERFGETKMANHIERILAGKYREKEKRMVDCLLIASGVEIFARVLVNENGKRRGTTLLNIDYAYENMYAIPSDKNGIALLQLIQKAKWKEKMEGILLAGCKRQEETYSVVCDGYDEADGYILLFCTCNIAKLKKFLKRATNARPEEKFCIYCFTFQVPLLGKLGLTEITIKTMKLEEYLEMESIVTI